MKFSDLLEDLLNEGKKFSDEKFDLYMENAGWWLFNLFQDTPSDVRKIPELDDYLNYARKKSRDKIETVDDMVYSLPDFYGDWINLMDESKSNTVMSRTIARFNLQDKMSGRDSSVQKKRGRKPKSQNVEPQGDDAMSHFNQADQPTEKRRRGRPSLPDDQKKKYVPTGLPRGRRPKVSDAEAEPEFTLEPTDEPVIKQRGGARVGAGRPRKSGEDSPQPLQEPIKKMRGRPSKESRYEPEMQQSKIKTLEDRIASLEALLREKGLLQEQRTLLESRLRMMKDYQKFL
jgi:hypothetical protein